MITFEAFPKIGRLAKDMIITEKLDGTNAQVVITEDGEIGACSRTRVITPGKDTDNYGFAGWVHENREELLKLGPGRHFGEWWGRGIQRNYNLNERRFSLFNVSRWIDSHAGVGDPVYGDEVAPTCCHVVPVLYLAEFNTRWVDAMLSTLNDHGSVAAPGYMNPEGIIVFHTATKATFKKTFDDAHKEIK